MTRAQKPTTLTVSAACTVVKTVDGGERYLYRGTIIAPGTYDATDVERLISLGHLSPVTSTNSNADEATNGDKSA